MKNYIQKVTKLPVEASSATIVAENKLQARMELGPVNNQAGGEATRVALPRSGEFVQMYGDTMDKKKRACMVIQNCLIQLIMLRPPTLKVDWRAELLLLFNYWGPPRTAYLNSDSYCYTDTEQTITPFCRTFMVNTRSNLLTVTERLQPAQRYLDITVEPTVDDTYVEDGDSFDLPLNYTISVAQFSELDGKKPISLDFADTVYNRNSSQHRTISCSRLSCSNFTLARIRITSAGFVFLNVSFNLTGKIPQYIASFEVKGRTTNLDYSFLDMWVNIVLFVASLVSAVWFHLNLLKVRRHNPQLLIFEQRFLLWLNFALVLWFNPISIADTYFPSQFTMVWTGISNAVFLSAFLLFWMIMFRRIITEDYQRPTSRCHWVFVAAAIGYFALVLTFAMLNVASTVRDPGFSARNEYPRATLTVFLLSNLLVALMFLHFAFSSVMMFLKWRGRPVRHKAFMVSTFSFLIIFGVVLVCRLATTNAIDFLRFEMILFFFLAMMNYNDIYSFTKVTDAIARKTNSLSTLTC